ncbi:MAG: diguanylate cyclase [Leptonema sp. (in: bacteria)]
MNISFPEEILNYEKKIYDQRQLIEISRALNSTLDYKYLINAILDMCLAHVQTLSAGLFLNTDIDSEEICLIPDYKGFDLFYSIEHYKIPTDSKFVQFFEANTKSYTLTELENSIYSDNIATLLKEMGVHLVVPMKAKGKILGFIILGEKIDGKDYLESEKNFLVDLASLGAIAVDNAKLYERATTDLMTGLKNHAYFQNRLKEEREKSLKRGTSLYLILTDVDKFKNFNDTYGHQAGDEVLKSVAKVLQSFQKGTSFASRYGGEEFCLVITGIKDDSEVLKIAEEYRSKIEQMVVHYEGKELKVTVSAGIAKFNPILDSKTNRNLIERADKALYECKRKGRNRVEFYTESLENI